MPSMVCCIDYKLSTDSLDCYVRKLMHHQPYYMLVLSTHVHALVLNLHRRDCPTKFGWMLLVSPLMPNLVHPGLSLLHSAHAGCYCCNDYSWTSASSWAGYVSAMTLSMPALRLEMKSRTTASGSQSSSSSLPSSMLPCSSPTRCSRSRKLWKSMPCVSCTMAAQH